MAADSDVYYWSVLALESVFNVSQVFKQPGAADRGMEPNILDVRKH